MFADRAKSAVMDKNYHIALSAVQDCFQENIISNVQQLEQSELRCAPSCSTALTCLISHCPHRAARLWNRRCDD